MASTIDNKHSSVANQALQQTIHGDVNIHGSANDQGKEREECLGKLLLNDPKEVKDALKARKGHRVKGTCEWFLDTTELIQWRESKSPSTNLFWLAGHPGTGKSTLAIFLVEALERDLPLAPDALLAYFFCDTSAHDQNTAVAILRGLIYQMCRQHLSLLDRYLLPEWRVKKGKIFASFDALWSIFFSMATDTSTGQKFFVLDALDECDAESQRLLLHQLEQCFAQSTSESESSNIHFLITSRPYAEIREMLEEFPHKDMAHFPEVQRDVEAFVKERVTRLAQRKKYTTKLQQEVTEILKLKAEGTFLWVGLACSELEKLSAKAGLDRIRGFPSGLTSIYDSLLRRALQEASDAGEDPAMVKRVLQVVAIVMEPITLQELAVACRLHEHEDDEERLLYTENTIDLCRLMVVVDDKYVRLLHKSVKDFLFLSGAGTLMNTLESHAELAYRCVDLLIEDHRNRQNGATTTFNDCFVEYSVRYWPEHACLAKDRYKVLPRQYEFFSHVSPSRDAWLNFSLALGEDIPLYFSLFHVAARWGILPLIDYMETRLYLDSDNMQGISKLDSFSIDFKRIRGNPVRAAVVAGHAEVLHRLLDFGVTQTNDRLTFRKYGTIQEESEKRNCFSFSLTPDVIMMAVCTSLEMVEVLLNCRDREFVLEEDIIEEAASDQTNGQQLLRMFCDKFGQNIQVSDRIIQTAIANPNVDNTMIQFLINKAVRDGSPLAMQNILELLVQHRDAIMIDLFLRSYRTSVSLNLDVLQAVSPDKLQGRDALSRMLDVLPEGAIVVTQDLIEYVVRHFDLATLSSVVDIDNVAVTEDLLEMAARNSYCADSMVSVLLSQAPDIKTTEAVLKAAASNRLHASSTLPMLCERGLAEIVSASNILERAIRDHSDIYGVTKALAADYPGLLRQISDSVFQQLAMESTLSTDPIVLGEVQRTMIELLTCQSFGIEMTATIVDAVAATGTPEEYLLPWLFSSDDFRPIHFLDFWRLPVHKFSMGVIHTLLSKMDDSASAYTSLIRNAILADRQDIVKYFLLERSDIPVQDAVFSSAMYEAVVGGNLPIMQLLVDRGMRMEHYCLDSSSGLIRAAASSGDIRILRKVLEMGADVQATEDSLALSLRDAIASVKKREMSGQVVKFLLEHGADPNAAHSSDGSLLQQAAADGNLAAVEALLAAGADVKALGGRYGSALQAAVCATRQWDETTRVMIKHGADLNVQGGEHGSALGAALSHGRLRLANLLLRLGARLPDDVVNYVLVKASPLKLTLSFVLRQHASVKLRDDLGWSCLHKLIRRFGSFAATPYIFQMLHEAGADVLARGRANRTPLIEASAHGQSEVVRWLLSVGASVHDRDIFGCTALHYAIQVDSDTTWALVEAGADITATDGTGSTVLHRASSHGKVGNVVWIIDAVRRRIEQHPASARPPKHLTSITKFINYQDHLQRSALHLALYGDHMEVVETLLLEGAQTNLADGNGTTLETWASASSSQKQAWASLPTSVIPTAKRLLAEAFTPLRVIIRAIREYGGSDHAQYCSWLGHYLKAQKQFEEATTALEQCVKPGSGTSRDTVEHYALCDSCNCDPIVGIRHTCTICSDCDLCSECWGKRSFFVESLCCGDHTASFIQIPRLSWSGLESATINPQGETKDQWLERLDRTFGAC